MTASKSTNIITALCGALFTASVLAQSTVFTYQGRLNDGGSAASGSYDFEFSLFDVANAGTAVVDPLTNNAVAVSNGLFTVPLDFGTGVFDGTQLWLEIGVQTNGGGGFTTLSPRTELTAAPYAHYAPSAGAAGTAMSVLGAVSAAQLSGTIPPANIGVDTIDVTMLTSNSVGSSEISDGTVGVADLDTVVLFDTYWRLSGNTGTIPGTHFLGTKGNQALELKVNNQRAVRIEPTTAAPNLIAGSDGNAIASGSEGSVIAGGGSTTPGYENTIGAGANYSTISGGWNNEIDDHATVATIVGGAVNYIAEKSHYGAIGGGGYNTIVDNSSYATISGGFGHLISMNGDYNTIGGGFHSKIASNSVSVTISGGDQHDIGVNASYSFIGGGVDNNIASDSLSATISGGSTNSIGVNSDYSAVGGGENNNIENTSHRATIAGGGNNDISANSDSSAIGGGRNNSISYDSQSATIAGGYQNSIAHYADRATIAGGSHNDIGGGSSYGVIGGGIFNVITSGTWNATIAGGSHNDIGTDSESSTIGGGYGNSIASNSGGSTIAGGIENGIDTYSYRSAIGGGDNNSVADNSSYGVISGGYQNDIGTHASYAIIPGGCDNEVGGYISYAFAAGRRAKAYHSGVFVWADSTDADFASTADKQFNVRANGGVRLETGGAGILLDGSPLVSGGVIQGNGSGLASVDADLLDGLNSTAFAGASHAHSGAEITSGTVADPRLSSNIPRLNSSPVFTGTVTAGGDLVADRLKVGTGHTLSGNRATIGGGQNNQATDVYTSVGGGYSNRAINNNATIPGGYNNLAEGDSSIVVGGADNTVSGNYSLAGGRYAQATHNGSFVWSSGATTASFANNSFTARAHGGVRFYSAGGTTNGVQLAAGGGSWSSLSDRNMKENFTSVDAREVLDKVVALPVTTWNYKAQPSAIRHIGPMAQDFATTFCVGEDAHYINSSDVDGVALAAIQGLNQKLEQENAELRQRMERLERLVEQLGGAQ